MKIRILAIIAAALLFIFNFTLNAAPSLSNISSQNSEKIQPKATPTITQKEQLSLIIEKVTIIDHGDSMSWYAQTKNIGPRIEKNQLEISAYQIMGSKQLGDAGTTIVWNKSMSTGDTVQFTRQNWQRKSDAGQLKVVILNKKTGLTISKSVSLPKATDKITQNSASAAQPGSMSPQQFTDPTQNLSIEEATYLGRGRFRLKIKNEGNRAVNSNQLEIRPIYHIANRLPVIGKTATNNVPIYAGKIQSFVAGGNSIYANGEPECISLNKLALEIKNPFTGQMSTQEIDIQKPKGEITSFKMKYSTVQYTVKNTGTYTTKYNLKTTRMSVFDDYSRNTTDTYSNKVAVIHGDLFKTSVTVEPGKTKTVEISDTRRVNNEIARYFPKLKKNLYYGARFFSIVLFLPEKTEYCNNPDYAFYGEQNIDFITGGGSGIEISTFD